MITNRDLWTVEAMNQYGGSFVKALAKTAQVADHVNLALIKSTWPEYWKRYEEMGRKLEEQEK